MNTFLYDGSFEGFLSSIFYSYEMKIVPVKIESINRYQEQLFDKTFIINTERKKAERVWNKIRKKVSQVSSDGLFRVFLSELPGCEILLFDYMNLIINSKINIETDFTNDTILKVTEINQKVARETHYLQMFVRFQLTKDNIYFASFEPRYDILPLGIKHFKDRYKDQKWVIFDVIRNYGYYYDLKDVSEVHFTSKNTDLSKGKLGKDFIDSSEDFYQGLWQCYYKATSIKERKNLKLRRQHMPKRFWKYLPEIG